MKRFLVVAVPVAILLGGCAVGDNKPATYVSDVSATLNGDVYSNVAGDTEYWWKYGETNAYGTETPHRTIAIADSEAHPVSEPVGGLDAGTIYHYAMCVQDSEESPPRANCSTDRMVTTGSQPGTSGIAFSRANNIWRMGPGGEDPLLLTEPSGGKAWPAWSPDGRRIASTWQIGAEPGIVVMDADGGSPVNLTPDAAVDFTPAWSPDGSRIAFFSSRDGDDEIWVMDAGGDNLVNLTDNSGVDQYPSWSPDGRRIAFSSRRDGNDDVYVMNADGTGVEQLTDGPVNGNVIPAWSPDGRKIAFVANRDINDEIYVMDADGSNETRLTDSARSDAWPTWSPDGSKIAFQSTSPTPTSS